MNVTTSTETTTTLFLNVRRGARRSDHVFVLSKPIANADKLGPQLSAIGNGGRFASTFETTPDGKTVVKVAIMSSGREELYARKLHDIAAEFAEQTHTPEDEVLITVERALTTSLAELSSLLNLAPGRAYEVDITVREFDDGLRR